MTAATRKTADLYAMFRCEVVKVELRGELSNSLRHEKNLRSVPRMEVKPLAVVKTPDYHIYEFDPPFQGLLRMAPLRAALRRLPHSRLLHRVLHLQQPVQIVPSRSDSKFLRNLFANDQTEATENGAA